MDDGSSDGSAEVVKGFGDPRIRVVPHGANRGPSAARNTALRAARGPWIALIDSDDEWLPDKLERQLAFLAQSGSDAVGCEYWLVEGERTEHVRLPAPASWAEDLHTAMPARQRHHAARAEDLLRGDRPLRRGAAAV